METHFLPLADIPNNSKIKSESFCSPLSLTKNSIKLDITTYAYGKIICTSASIITINKDPNSREFEYQFKKALKEFAKDYEYRFKEAYKQSSEFELSEDVFEKELKHCMVFFKFQT